MRPKKVVTDVQLLLTNVHLPNKYMQVHIHIYVQQYIPVHCTLMFQIPVFLLILSIFVALYIATNSLLSATADIKFGMYSVNPSR